MAEKMDSSDFYFQWLRVFAAGISKEDIGKYVVATGNYLWHIFSWNLIAPQYYLQGQAARDAYDRVNKENAVYVDWFGEDRVKPVTKEVSTAKALEHFTEVYVAGPHFSWTYIKTHEGDHCGPYFYSRRLPDIFPVVKKHIDRMDYYALLASECPEDEFDMESRRISMQIDPGMSAREIASVIADVFNASFGEQDDAAVFLSVAERIKKDLCSLMRF